MKFKPHKLFTILAVFTMLVILGAVPAFAAEDAIPSIQVDVVLEQDGSAVIREIWDVRGVSGGTEYYKALDNMDGMRVHSLLVWDESGTQYKTLSTWDTGLTLLEKAGTSGILEKSDGYELCWGIGSYGDHQYTIQYTIEGLVKDYGDYAGFYHQFISELSSAPESAAINITLADTRLTEENARIWGYGFAGEVDIGSYGALRAFSSDALAGGDYVNILCRFDKNLFPLASKANLSFEELQETAEKGNEKVSGYVFASFAGVLAFIFFLSVFLATYFSSRYKMADGTVVKLPRQKDLHTNWSVPFDGSIPAIYFTMMLLRRELSCQRLMGAYLIRWQEKGYIRIEERIIGHKKKKAEKEDVIVFAPKKAPKQGVEMTLYQILAGACDADGVLWTSDIEESAQELYEKLIDWSQEVQESGQKELIHAGGAAMDAKGIIRFTAAGFQQGVKLLELQKALASMCKESDSTSAPRKSWGDYLVLAALFNTGEQVLESMKALDPAYFDTFSGIYGCNAYSMMYFMTMTTHISSASEPSIDGTGGAASSFGGGGFSGGGGGGSR